MSLVFRRINLWLAVTLLLAITGCNGIVNPQAARTLTARAGRASFTVYPSYIRSGKSTYDAQAAEELVEFIESRHYGKAHSSDQLVPITGEWRHNQARMLRESASDFAAFVKSHAIESEYAVLAECLMGSREIIGVHLYVLDSKGEVADVVLANSHHPEFASRSPKTVADCHAVIQDILCKQWMQARDEGTNRDSPKKD